MIGSYIIKKITTKLNEMKKIKGGYIFVQKEDIG